MRIGLVDKEFEHIQNPTCYTGYEPPKYIQWDRETPEQNKIVCFTERCYEYSRENRFDNCTKIAWPLEPRSIHQYAYDEIINKYLDCFDYVFCFDYDYMERFMSMGLKSIFWSPGGSYIHGNDWKIYPKSKNVQIIASKKDWTRGHRLRHEVISKFGYKIDSIYGRAYQYYNYQLEPFRDYRFAIVIENEIIHDYWTDKLLDCFLTGTVPIMWNDNFIEEYFNPDGMILWKEIGELFQILDVVNDKVYNKMMPAIKENFLKAQKYAVVEDQLYHNLFQSYED